MVLDADKSKVLLVIIKSIQLKGLDKGTSYSDILAEVVDTLDEPLQVLEDVMDYISQCKFLKTIMALDMMDSNQVHNSDMSKLIRKLKL